MSEDPRDNNYDLALDLLADAVHTANSSEREFALRTAQIHAVLAVADEIKELVDTYRSTLVRR